MKNDVQTSVNFGKIRRKRITGLFHVFSPIVPDTKLRPTDRRLPGTGGVSRKEVSALLSNWLDLSCR